MEALWDKRVLLIITATVQPIPEGAHATRTTTPRDYCMEGNTPRAKHVVRLHPTSLRADGCERRGRPAWPEPLRRHEDETRAWILIFDNVPTPSTACGRATRPKNVLIVVS